MDISPSTVLNAFGLSSILVGLSSAGFGSFILLRGPHKKLNRLWFAFSLAVASWGIGGLLISLSQDSTEALLLWRWAVVGVTWIPVLFYRFVCQLCSIPRRKTLFVYYLIGTTVSFLFVMTNLLFSGTRPVFNQFYWCVIGPLHPANMAWWSFVVFHGHYELWRAYRTSLGISRGQLKWVFLAGFIGYSAGLLEFLPNYGIDLYPLSNFVVPLYPAMMAYAIFRYQLFDIHGVIRKSLVYSMLITLLTTGYFGLVFGLEKLFQNTVGYQSPWVSLAAFALMAVLFQPLKIGIQRILDLLIFKAPQEELRRRIERLEEEAKQAERLRSVATLAAGMAHEIKNPLTALQTFAEFIPERHRDRKFAAKLHEVLTTETQRIGEIVQGVLDFSRPKAPQLKPVDPGQLIISTMNLLSSNLLKRRVKWTVDCQHNGATLQADPNQLRQVLINLIQNAADAMPKGGSLSIATKSENGHIELTVSDTGQGIPLELLPKIFDPFVSTKPNGNGLGLSVVHSIVRAHRGAIRADSHPGQGTTFTLRLPL